MATSRPHEIDECPMDRFLAIVGGKWKAVILWWLIDGTKRFGELRRHLPGITQKTLTQQLRELEADGLVTRKVFAEVPPRVEYTATPLAQSLGPVLRAMHDWAAEYLKAGRREKKKSRESN